MCLQNFLWPTSIKLRGTNPAEIAAKLGYGSNLKKKKASTDKESFKASQEYNDRCTYHL